MITPVLHLLRLLPFLFGGHRQLALENHPFQSHDERVERLIRSFERRV
jgi:hypothetical protein